MKQENTDSINLFAYCTNRRIIDLCKYSPVDVKKQGDVSIPQIKINFSLNSFLINELFRECNAKLPINGYLTGFFEPLTQRKNRFRREHSSPVAKFLIYYDFTLHRFLPKIIPIRTLKHLNHKFKLVKNRPISKGEMFGRLVFCGFHIVNYSEDENHLYFTAKKVDEPLREQIDYAAIIRMPRVGKDGKIINIYKFRTMHPYAQFLHKYMIEHQGFDENGKIQNDFRIPHWGRVFRRYWIDEIPQIINLIKGDIRLFGVRPLSMNIYMQYPKEFREERVKLKPGLIPPYYVDLPKSLSEVIESERKYLELRKQHPLFTDIRYLIKALTNIVFKGARSK